MNIERLDFNNQRRSSRPPHQAAELVRTCISERQATLDFKVRDGPQHRLLEVVRRCGQVSVRLRRQIRLPADSELKLAQAQRELRPPVVRGILSPYTVSR